MAKKKTTRKTSAKKQKPTLEELNQTTGKSYEEQVSKAKELEEILGIPKISPFRTNDKNVFNEMMKDMNLTDLQAYAVKVGVFPSGNKTVLKNKIKRAFESSLRGQGSVQVMGEPIKLDPNNPKHKQVLDYLGG
mgnify:FL=1|tara:strand:- start:11516 stop:11917 length:402 start_codon:yes stop_codon:yes gene_type:complete